MGLIDKMQEVIDADEDALQEKRERVYEFIEYQHTRMNNGGVPQEKRPL